MNSDLINRLKSSTTRRKNGFIISFLVNLYSVFKYLTRKKRRKIISMLNYAICFESSRLKLLEKIVSSLFILDSKYAIIIRCRDNVTPIYKGFWICLFARIELRLELITEHLNVRNQNDCHTSSSAKYIILFFRTVWEKLEFIWYVYLSQ